MHIEDGRELIERLGRGPGEGVWIFATEGGIAIQLFRRTPGGEWVPGEERLEIPASLLDRLREILDEAEERPALDPRAAAPRAPFVNASEEGFGRILDFYQLEWGYEPRSFPLEQK